MADHYLRSVELLDELDEIRAEIARLYAAPRVPGAAGRPVISPDVQWQLNALHARQGVVLKKAEIHALHGIRQAIQDAAVSAPVFYSPELVGGE